MIGFWSAVGTSFESEGCVEVTFGPIGFLNLPNEDSTPPADVSAPVQSVSTPPRYTKVVIEGRGVFIRDGKDGKIYDLLTRRVIE